MLLVNQFQVTAKLKLATAHFPYIHIPYIIEQKTKAKTELEQNPAKVQQRGLIFHACNNNNTNFCKKNLISYQMSCAAEGQLSTFTILTRDSNNVDIRTNIRLKMICASIPRLRTLRPKNKFNLSSWNSSLGMAVSAL